MRWNVKPQGWYRDWNPWFALYPVRIENTMVWWEWIERKFNTEYSGAYRGTWIYRDIDTWREKDQNSA